MQPSRRSLSALLALAIVGFLALSARGQIRNRSDRIIAIPGAKISSAQDASVAVAGAPESPSISSEKFKSNIQQPLLAPMKNDALVLSAQGSSVTYPVLTSKINVGQTSNGELWMTVSNDDGTPFTQAKAADVRIQALDEKDVAAALDRATSHPAEGLWHFVLPNLTPGSHFYRLSVETEITVTHTTGTGQNTVHTTYSGQIIARADYTRMPYWNAQRFDGTIWDPPH